MTDDELLREVTAMLESGNRGESEALEGTPEGTYLWMRALRAVPINPSASLTFTTTVELHSVPVGSALLPRQELSIGAVPPNP